MSLRPLIIDDAAKAKVARVLAHAEAHHYHPGQPPPGDDARFVAKLDTYRAVFSYTHSDGLVWRHLSVSVPSSKLPNPIAVFMIADLFGFTGFDDHRPSEPGADWLIDVHEADNCIVLAQSIASEPGKQLN